MDGSDDFPYDDVWSSSLHEELFADYNPASSWSSDARQHGDNLPLPITYFPPLPNPPSRPTLLQQQRSNNTTPANSSIFNFHTSVPLERKRSHLDLPNFPLATDPRGSTISNSSGRPPPASSTLPQRIPASPPIRNLPSPPAPPSLDSFWSSSDISSLASDDSDREGQDSDGFVDLTRDSSPLDMPPTRRPTPRLPQRRTAMTVPSLPSRSRTHSEVPSNPAKRRKTGTEASQSSQRSKKVEEVDLRDVDDNQGLSKVLEQQRMATIKAQQEQANKPVKLSTLQCIICMENMKDLTATHCGHLFCHSCLMEALIAGENQGSDPGKGTPKCPVCRKKVIRPTDRKDLHHLVPIAIKLKTTSKAGKGKGRAID